ncbi:GUN4 domain protein [[Leptolyngbya] sp. PCC 7376]|uniref:GUN4 domain-containing protein n=1 Tax=[Leptolyngbya] sp. PCC 7376 TaxID=111781 RepID=UPI00029F104D|nr:GUN4 domain-containing protein [[Leptolyngbya] sp. PCC 7376]AFY38294.1 GUN4 domain protein [[Leptolyngbya] sp. PCC 7376]
MARNWAICIGVNEYDNLPNLSFAKRDAEKMQQYFRSDVKFDKVYLFTDDSPPIDDADKPYASRPTYGALRRFLRVRFEEDFLSDGDNLWFFFSGHGIRHQDRDYLLPSDADPDPAGIEDTAIPISYVSERLRRSGADNVILLLDACRSEQSSKDMGIGNEKQQGVITFSSCSPAERSYEIEALEQGAFTYALLESLRIQGEGNCATVERLSKRIKYRVKEINRDYEKPKQTPYPIVEPASKYHLILLPDAATAQDITTLKCDALLAETKKQWDVAKQLWMRVNVAARGTDMDAIEAIQRFPTFGIMLIESVVKPKTVIKSATPPLISAEIKTEKIAAKPAPKMQKRELLKIIIPERYQQLDSYLKAQKFKDADKETVRVMREVVGKESNQDLNVDDIRLFPCKDLKTIDGLWKKYSNDKFGFSIQNHIWLDCGGVPEIHDWDTYIRYAKQVKWYGNGSFNNGEFFDYSQLNFSLKGVKGHLPRLYERVQGWYPTSYYLFGCLERCKKLKDYKIPMYPK